MFVQENNAAYRPNGVHVSPEVPTFGESVKIVYDGLLAKSGAQELYAHIGFGNTWAGTSDFKMNKTATGFEAVVPVSSQGPLQVAFKDNANNWDNNGGYNYTFTVAQ
jgi:hypothetical protein